MRKKFFMTTILMKVLVMGDLIILYLPALRSLGFWVSGFGFRVFGFEGAELRVTSACVAFEEVLCFG